MAMHEEIPGDSHLFDSDHEVAQLKHAIQSPGLFVRNLFERAKSPELAPLLTGLGAERGASYRVRHDSRRKRRHPLKAMTHSNLMDARRIGIHALADGPAIVLFQKMEWTQPSWLQHPDTSAVACAANEAFDVEEFFIPSYWNVGLKRAIQLKKSKSEKRPPAEQARLRLTLFHSSRRDGGEGRDPVSAAKAEPRLRHDSASLAVPAGSETTHDLVSMPVTPTFVYQPVLDSTLSEEFYLEHPMAAKELARASYERGEQPGSQGSLGVASSVEVNIMDDSPVSNVASQTASKKTKRGGRRLPTLLLNQPLAVIESGVGRLTEMEVSFCSRLKLDPRVYVNSKETMIRTAHAKGPFKKTAAQKMFRMDVNKTGKIYDFIVSKGWIERPP